MEWSFTKYHGAGNDFILIDDRNLTFPAHDVHLIERLCHRHFGIGADGFILLQPSDKGDFLMRIFNSDGKEAEMCGNGLRCLVHFAHSLGIIKETYFVETLASVMACQLSGERVTSSFKSSVQKSFDVETHKVHVVNAGVPHAVVFVPTLDMPDFCEEARKIRFHPLFHPEGVNVNFVVLQEDGMLSCRTYERGVEGETLCCGTGAVAVAIIARNVYQMASSVKVLPKSQEILEVDIDDSSIFMTGPVHRVFAGSFAF